MRWVIGVLLLGLWIRVFASPVPGDRVGDFTLKTNAGVPWHWKPGKTTVITFCAFWCDTWKNQLPRVSEAQRLVTGLPVDFVSISVDGRWSDKEASRHGLILNDAGSALTREMGVDRVPYTLVVDPKGVVKWAQSGILRSKELALGIRESVFPTSESEEKAVYLTFDDFPAPRLSFELLDELRALQAPATLFCVCSHLDPESPLERELVDQGFRPQIHSWDHDRTHPALQECVEAIKRLGCPTPTLYRPPGSEKILNLKGQPLSLPVDDPYDFSRPGSAEICRRVLSAVRNGSVIQLHAGVSDTLEALPIIVKNLRDRGYTLKTLDHR